MLVNIKTGEGGSTTPTGRVNIPDPNITIEAFPDDDYVFDRWEVTSICIADIPEYCPPLEQFTSLDNPLMFSDTLSLEFTVTPFFRLIGEPPDKRLSLIWLLIPIGITLGVIYLATRK